MSRLYDSYEYHALVAPPTPERIKFVRSAFNVQLTKK